MKEIEVQEGCALKLFIILCKEGEKRLKTSDNNFEEQISCKLPIQFLWNLVCTLGHVCVEHKICNCGKLVQWF